jgi:hypothetical protein
MEKDFDDDILGLELAAKLSEREKELLGRMREIYKTLNLPALSLNTRDLVLSWLAGRLPADSSDEQIAREIREAFQTLMFVGTRSHPIFPSAVYARRAAVRR